MDYIVPGFLRGTVGALVSPGGVGKSMWALQVGLMIAGLGDLLAIGQCKPGRVIYLSSEDDSEPIHHRIDALKGIVPMEAWDSIDDMFSIFPLVGRDCSVVERNFTNMIKQRCKDCRLIIVDTLRRFHDREENSSSEMAQVIKELEKITRATGAAVLFLHHVGKSAALAGTGDEQQATRGSSVLTDNVRWQGYIVSMSKTETKKFKIPEEVRQYFCRFGVSKQNYAPPFRDVWYRRGPWGILIPIQEEDMPKVAEKLYTPSARKVSGSLQRRKGGQHGTL